jgi:hypothetical protein
MINNISDSITKPSASSSVDATEKYFEENFYYSQNLKSENVLKSTAHYIRKYYTPSFGCATMFFYKRLPFFKWIQSYDIRKWLIKDLIAGLTVFVLFFHLNED